MNKDQIIRMTFKTYPLFHTLGQPGQIPEKSLYSHSIPDAQNFLPLTHTGFLENACREGLGKKRMENEPERD